MHIKYALVRQTILAMDEDGVERKVAVCYMRNYCDLDIREYLCISKKRLHEARVKIKNALLEAGIFDED